jgi:DNA-directed RNA polymerase specialized sigma24 family protein
MRLALLCSLKDERLVALARLGHEQAFEAIVRRYRRPLLEAHAEAVVDDALGAARGRLRRGEEVGDLRAWLCAIVRATAARALFDALAADDVARATVSTVARLPARQREALLQRAAHDAGELGASRFHRARAVASALVPMPVLTRLASGDRGTLPAR